MCGLTGFLTQEVKSEVDLRNSISRMAAQLSHRGPDDSGVWIEPSVGCALGFRRLAIIDLSPEGHQPMASMCGRYIIVFNGEVYNFKILRRQLEGEGQKFRGNSDTEVMLAAISQWGIETATKKFVGMFAFALWDRQERAIHLVRDRLGIKPLYYGLAAKTFLFGSELKALRAHPDFVPEINRDALTLQMRHSYIPQPYSIYKGIHKLKPGCILTVRASELPFRSLAAPAPYWSAEEVYMQGMADPFTGSEAEVAMQLEELLREAIGMRMVADVPLGAFLSGGLDSSTVVALMQAQSTSPVKTFTIGFHESDYNEARQAKAVATHLGTDHTELYVTPAEAMAVIPGLPSLYDEPFSDSSQIPTYLVSALAKSHVTVSLSGDGGDELFGGYNRYVLGDAVWKKVRWMGKSGRRLAAGGLNSLGRQTLRRLMVLADLALPKRFHIANPADKVSKLAEVLDVNTAQEFYRALISHWNPSSAIVLGAAEPPTTFSDPSKWNLLPEFLDQVMCLDLITYMPDDILTKVDRASMGVSLEARVPLLDHRVVEFAARTPLSMKIREGKGKWLLRRILYQHLPQDLVDRPKMGFGIPIDDWLRGPLCSWAEDLLNEDRLRREGFLRPELIRKVWSEHLSGRKNWQHHLWDVLVFQSWLADSRTAPCTSGLQSKDVPLVELKTSN